MLLERGARITAFLLDALVSLLGALGGWIIVTGGGVIFVRGQRISLTGVDNPLLGLALLVVIRWFAFRSIPWLGVRRWPGPRAARNTSSRERLRASPR